MPCLIVELAKKLQIFSCVRVVIDNESSERFTLVKVWLSLTYLSLMTCLHY